jgi:predicted metal-dependent hydrolase
VQVRHPTFDLSASVPHWGDHVDACNVINGGAVIPPPIERYLIKVMRQARQLLDPVADADLLADLAVFSRQEGQHLRLHTDYLEMLRLGGYPRIREYEAAFEADLDGFLATRGLGWNLAYAEAFESTGTAMAEAWLDGRIAALCGDRGSEPMRLWMWHMAEEFEHRRVVHDVMARLFGPDEALRLRTEVVAFGRDHFSNHAAAAVAYLYEVDRSSMTEAEEAASLDREVQTWLAYGEVVGDAMGWVFEPGYDPSAVTVPAGYAATLAAYS